MAIRSTTRDGIEVHRFHWAVQGGIPVLAILLQVSLPRIASFFATVDLPLLVVIFFAVARRNQIVGSVGGALIGALQDAMTHLPLGLYSIAKTIIGYLASSISVKVDVENPGSRLLMTFGFYLLHRGIYQWVATSMARLTVPFSWPQELFAAFINGLIAMVLFGFMDRLKLRK